MASSVQLLQFLQSDPHNLLLCAVVSVGVHLLQWFLYGVINKYIRPRKSVIEVFPAPYFNIGCLAVFSFGLSVPLKQIFVTDHWGSAHVIVYQHTRYAHPIRQYVWLQLGSQIMTCRWH